MLKQRNSVVVVLDIGSSKILCIAVKFVAGGEVEVVGHSCSASGGIKSGLVTDLQAAVHSIMNAVEGVEQSAGVRVSSVYVNISSNSILSHQLSAEIDVTGHEINAKDMSKLLFNVLDKYKDQNVSVIHSFIYDYILNGNRGIINPLGMYGSNLACDVNVLISPSNIIANLANCLEKCQLGVNGYISSAYAAGIACLSTDEMSFGVIFIEIGAGCSSISVFANGQMIFTDGISFGGISITGDIAKGLSTTFENAERIKNLYGTVIATSADGSDMIEIAPENDNEDQHVVLRSTLSEIIKARVEEILELLAHKLRNAGFANISQKIVITGGGVNLNGIKELVGHFFSAKVRIGYARQMKGLSDISKDLGFVTAMGMISHIAKTIRAMPLAQSEHKSAGGKMWQWLKDNFI